MASTMNIQPPSAPTPAAALAGAAEAGAAILHDVAASASAVPGGSRDTDRQGASSATAAAGPASDQVRQAASAAAGAGRDLVALIRHFPLLSVLAGLGIGFKIAQVLYRPAPKKTAQAEQD